MKKNCLICGKEFEARDDRKKYCSEACARESQRNAYRKWKEAERAKRAAEPPIACPICGKEFKPLTGAYKYCSKDCSAIAEKRNLHKYWVRRMANKEYIRTCERCGKEFRAGCKTTKYCSQECRHIASVEKQKITYWSRHPKIEEKKSPEEFAERRGIIYAEEAKRLGKWYTDLSKSAIEADGKDTTYGKLNAPKVEVFVPKNLRSAKERL